MTCSAVGLIATGMRMSPRSATTKHYVMSLRDCFRCAGHVAPLDASVDALSDVLDLIHL